MQYINAYNDTGNFGLQPAYLSVIARAPFLVLDFTIKCTMVKRFQIGLYISNNVFSYCAINPYCLTTHPNRLDETNRTHFKLNHSDWSKN